MAVAVEVLTCGLLVQVAIPPEQEAQAVAVLVAQMEPTEATEQLTQVVGVVLAVEQETTAQATIQQLLVALAALALSLSKYLTT